RVLDRGRVTGRERGWARLEAAMIVDQLRMANRRDLDADAPLASRLQEIAAKVDRESSSGRETAVLCELGLGYHAGLTRVGSGGARQIEKVIEELGPVVAAPLRAQALLMLAEQCQDGGQRHAAHRRRQEGRTDGAQPVVVQSSCACRSEVIA